MKFIYTPVTMEFIYTPATIVDIAIIVIGVIAVIVGLVILYNDSKAYIILYNDSKAYKG